MDHRSDLNASKKFEDPLSLSSMQALLPNSLTPAKRFIEKSSAMFKGIAAGDALGLPVETLSAAVIFEKFGAFSDLITVDGTNTYLPSLPKGTWSDDTQLTLAVAKAIVEAGGLNLDKMIAAHIEAYNQSTLGWGSSTREAVKKLMEGQHWTVSGLNSGSRRGTGNGVVMKIAPIAAYLAAKNESIYEHAEFIVSLTRMTHSTCLAISSAFAQIAAVKYCFEHSPTNFDPDQFSETIIEASRFGNSHMTPTEQEEDLALRLESLRKWREYSPQDIISEMKGRMSRTSLAF